MSTSLHSGRHLALRRGRGGLVAAVAIAIVATVACSGTVAAVRARHAATATVRYADLPARLCLAADARTLADAARGRAWMTLALRNRSPSDRYSPAFTLSLIEGTQRRALQAIGMQPDHVERGRVQPQRFRIALGDAAPQPDAHGRLCFELQAAPDEGARPPGAMLEIDLRWTTSATAP